MLWRVNTMVSKKIYLALLLAICMMFTLPSAQAANGVISIMPDRGYAQTTAITVTGTNYTTSASTSIDITFDGAVVTSANVDASGNFLGSFVIPQKIPGTYYVTTQSLDTDPSPGLSLIVNNSAPVIGSSPSTNEVVVGNQWTYQMSATDANGDTVIFQSSNPKFIVSSATGLVTFTPTEEGRETTDLTAIDGRGGVDTETVSVEALHESYDNMVRITDVDLNDDEFYPLNMMEIEVEVENRLTLDQKSVEVEVSSDSLDVKEESSSFKLDEYGDDDDTETTEIEIEVPLDAEEGEYDLLIVVTAKDDDGEYHRARTTETIEIIKEENELYFESIVINPTSLSCGGPIELSAKVWNLGESDEDVQVRLSNSELDLDIVTEEFELENEGSKQDKSVKLTALLPTNIEPKDYSLEIDAEFNNGVDEKKEYKTVNIACSSYTGPTTTSDGTSDDQTPDTGPATSISLKKGEIGKFSITITNTYPTTKTFTTVVSGISDWGEARAEPETVTLTPGGSVPVFVYVTPGANADDSESATVSVYSGTDLISTQALSATIGSGLEIEEFEHLSESASSIFGENALLKIMIILFIIVLVAIPIGLFWENKPDFLKFPKNRSKTKTRTKSKTRARTKRRRRR